MKKRYTRPRVGITVADGEPLAGDSYIQNTDVPSGGGGIIGARRWRDGGMRPDDDEEEEEETADTLMVVRRSLWEE